MSFFKDLRRRSKARASFHSSWSTSEPSPQCNGNRDTSVNGKSDSTTNSSSQSPVNTPSPSLKFGHSSNHLPIPASKSEGWLSPPQRPVPIGYQSNRNSIVNITNGSSRSIPPLSPFSPRVISISDNSWVHQKVLLIYGQIGDEHRNSLDGSIVIGSMQDSFPSISWPVRASSFKALVHLFPGPNKIRLEFTSPKSSPGASHVSWININHLPVPNFPPLELAILVGKDSDGRFDSAPNDPANGLGHAVRKFRMAAHLWQAFTGEQMYRNNFGRRCFRLDEEWQTGTLSCRDTESGQMRSEAKVHIVQSEKTVAELRALDSSNELFDVAMQAARSHFDMKPGQKRYIALLLLDSHWDSHTKSLTGHAAFGSSLDDIKLAIFGSHGLYSYPSCFEEMVAAFSDCTRADPEYVANDNNECGSNWETASSTMGRHLHEVGRLFGCPRNDDGIMGRDYLHFNRTFMTWEPYSTRTKEQGSHLLMHQDECGWHRLDVLRFRFHPCFRLPSDAPLPPDDPIQVWAVDGGKILVSSGSGIAFIEIFVEDNENCTSFNEYVRPDAGNCDVSKQVTLTEQGIRSQLPDNLKKSKRVKLVVHSGSLRSFTVDDINELKTKYSTVKISKGQTGYRTYKSNISHPAGSLFQELILESAFIQTKLLTSIKVYVSSAVNAIEFCYEDATSQIFGKATTGQQHNEYVLDTRRGEVLMGFSVRYGQGLEGIGILTSLGRKSSIYGNRKVGSGGAIIPPRGYNVAGVTGTVGAWINEISLVISR
ncbi:hypothetical protein FQN57_006730 [Myotisia sp. PD_48]|nr:hypothetical protein FQN57_006730 [Myotisia sp. PD_48]